eukprot:CAMPEP_0116018228 /NCGR_PEP_ID=MMETSP0321-20121206/8520_1 /TAXON_ID=163516 /ORGANISM="Leptocylindrus danicus var. danicus, Strain B650" /LENGTH=181 /DNA_ID=CAMNT_0003488575 /DNA_START=40 /DNA_END=586 /DNA_ORIENTATION=+
MIWVQVYRFDQEPSMVASQISVAVAVLLEFCRPGAETEADEVFFEYQVLRRGARAVLQFYPETAEQAILISECAAKVGFAGGIVVDYPNSAKAKKHYLVLSFDRSTKTPAALSETSLLGEKGDYGVRVDQTGKKKGKHVRKKKGGGKTKEWILQKKETQRKRGKDVKADTKFTGRKRPTRF